MGFFLYTKFMKKETLCEGYVFFINQQGCGVLRGKLLKKCGMPEL